MSRRSLLSVPAFVLVAFTLVAAAHAARAQDRLLQVVSPWEVTSLEPSDTGYIAVRLGIAEPLTGVEPDGRIVGLVAESWTVSDDKLTWRFHIRPGLRFHDGTPVTAAAVVASFERGRPNAESLQSLPIASIVADGDAMVITTKTSYAPLPAFLADWGGIILAPSSFAPDGKVIAWVGTGPYKVTKVEGDRSIELQAADTAGTPPAIKRVRYTAAPLGETRAAMIESGDADLAFTLAPVAVARINAGRRARVESLTIPRVRLMAFNTTLPMFADLKTRQAISLAIDRTGIATAILRHPPSAATQLFPPVMTGWHDPVQQPIPRAAARARALLNEAGWTAGPDGILTRARQPFRFTVLVPGNRPELAPMAAAMQAQLREIGLDMQIKVGPASGIAQAHKDGSLQAAFLARTYVNVPDPIGTVISDLTRTSSTWASEGWTNAELNQLTAEYVATFDPARLPALRARIAAIIQAELPIVTVAWYEHTVAVSNCIRGVQVDPYETRYLIERMSWAE